MQARLTMIAHRHPAIAASVSLLGVIFFSSQLRLLPDRLIGALRQPPVAALLLARADAVIE
jgi:hypothetical protein